MCSRVCLVFVLFCISRAVSDDAIDNLKIPHCDKAECVIAASTMHNAIDNSLNPCDDFYKFVCGRFLDNTVIHDRFGDETFASKAEEKEKVKLKKLLETRSENDDNRAFRLMKNFYKTCLDHGRLNVLGMRPLLEAFEELGGWPLLDKDWNANQHDWLTLCRKMFNFGFTTNYLIKVLIEGDPRESSRYIIKVEIPEEHPLMSFKAQLIEGLQNNKVKAYYDYMVDYTTLLGAERSTAEGEMLDVLTFEAELHKLSLLDEDDDEVQLYYSVDEMDKKFPYMNWLTFLDFQMSGSEKLDGKTELSFKQPKFFESFGQLISKTPTRIVANYLFWRNADRFKSFLANKFYEPGLQFFKDVFKVSRIEEGWKRCLIFTKRYFSVAIGALHARSNKVSISKDVETFINLAKEETLKYVTTQLNINKEESKEFANRIDDTKIIFKPPTQFYDEFTLEDYYRDLVIYNGQHFKNILRLQTFAAEKIGARLFKPISETLWQAYIEDLFDETYYSSDLRFISFGSSEFTSPHYHHDLPIYLNFAGIGYKVIKYLTFALNVEAKNLNLKVFEEKSKCLQSQYESFIAEHYNITIDGSKVSFQINADFLSYYLSYKTYQSWRNSAETEPIKLPGLNFSSEQFFWIRSAQRSCSVDRSVEVTTRKIFSNYPIDSFRVINSLSNNEDFSRDFKCAPSSAMNFKDKC